MLIASTVRRTTPRTWCVRALTLVEVLVVVGVVFLLIGLVFPVMSGGIRSSGRAVCLAELRDIGRTFAIYSFDNDEHWPFGMKYVEEANRWAAYFRGRAYPLHHQPPPQDYLASSGLWHAPLIDQYYNGDALSEALICPSDTRLGDRAEIIRAIEMGSMGSPDELLYQLDRVVSLSLYLDPDALAEDTPAPIRTHMRVTRVSEMLFPSQKAVLYDSSAWHDPIAHPDAGPSRPGYSRSHSVLAGDGSVAHRRRSDSTLPVMFTNLPAGNWFDGIEDFLRREAAAFNLTRDGVRGRDW